MAASQSVAAEESKLGAAPSSFVLARCFFALLAKGLRRCSFLLACFTPSPYSGHLRSSLVLFNAAQLYNCIKSWFDWDPVNFAEERQDFTAVD